MPRPLFADIVLPPSSSGPSRRNDANDTVIDEALARKLEMALNEVQPLLEDAEQKQFTNGAVRNWLIELKCSIYDAESTLDFIRNVALSNKAPEEVPYDSSALIEFKQRIPGKADNIVAILAGLIAKSGGLGLVADTSGVVVLPASLTRNRESTSLVKESDVFGRSQEEEKIMGWVLSQEPPIPGKKFDVVSIVGMGGVGKTTLAQLVYNDPRISSGDYLTSWVYVSDAFDKLKATRSTKEILVSITRKSYGDGWSWDLLQRELCEVLKGKKFLVVLDDVWDWDPKSRQVWDQFLTPFNQGAHGSKMIVTTRDDRVASALRSRHRLPLNELSEEDGWSFFSHSVFPTGQANARPQLVTIGREIVRKCIGLPLAIKAAVGILRVLNEDAIQWKRVLASKLWNVRSVLPALAISYCYLPQHLKRCFSYCSLYPKGKLISKDYMVKLWIDEGFVQLQNDIGSMEEESNYYFDELASRSFLNRWAHGDFYVMHDLTHDLAVFVSERIFKLFEAEKPITSYATNRHIHFQVWSEVRSLNFEVKFDHIVNSEDWSEVRSLKIGSSLSNYFAPCIPKEVFAEISCRLLFLRVLCLCGGLNDALPDTTGNLRLLRHFDMSKSKIKQLPVSLCNLSNVRYLDCNRCKDLQELPAQIGNLVSLQFLNVSSTPIKELPASLCLLPNLERIDCSGCDHLQQLPDEMGKLVSLRELHVYQTAIKELPASLCLLPNLEKLDCSRCDHLQQLPDEMGKLVSLRLLDVSYTAIKELLASLCLLPNLEKLDCSRCYHLQQLPDEMGKLVSLRELVVSYTAIKELPASLCLLGNLEMLLCSGCDHLQQLPDEMGKLVSLRRLDVSKTAIKEFPASLCLLGNLEKLVCSECDHLQQLPDEMGKLVSLRRLDVSKTAIKEFPASLCLLPNLERIDCSGCDHLQRLPDEMGKLVSLRELNVSDTAIKELPASLCLLPNLEKLDCFRCYHLQQLPDEMGKLVSLRELHMYHTAIKELPASLCLLRNLEMLICWGCDHLQQLPDEMGKLVSLRDLLVSYTAIKELPASLCLLPNLKRIGCSGCDHLQRLPDEMGKLVSLRELQMSRTAIKELPASLCLLRNLEMLNCSQCDHLQQLPDEMGKLVSLRELQVSRTAIKELPASLCLLPNLERIDCSGCDHLQRLPDEMGKLMSLRRLNVSDTAIKELPASLYLLPNLEKLH